MNLRSWVSVLHIGDGMGYIQGDIFTKKLGFSRDLVKTGFVTLLWNIVYCGVRGTKGRYVGG